MLESKISKTYLKYTWDAVVLLDTKGTIVYSNPSFNDLTGYGKEIHENPLDDLLIDKTFHDLYFENLDTLKQRRVLKISLSLRTSEGQPVHLESKIIPYHEPDSSVAYVLIGNDISHLVEQNKKVVSMEYELSKSKATIETFLYKSSHDLRSPIATIQGLVNIAKTDKDRTKILEYLDLISKNADRMDSMLAQIRNLSLLHTTDFEPENVNLNDILKETIDEISEYQYIGNIAFEINVRQNKSLNINRFITKRILKVLLDNACRYRKPGEQHKVTVELIEKRKYSHLNIVDNGKGIPDRIQKKIFNMFTKGEAETMNIGLGLYIAKVATDKLNWELHYRSREGEGTIFKLVIPHE